ncbi:MAG: response regulator transcription factor, partial [Rhodothermales bacterium]|nr:response regulator transcription factor [Rhodothermales bacterium]
GHTVCRRIRDACPNLPIVMLTALDAVEDRVAGLRAGADDYLGKPFAFEELLARIEANLRRAALAAASLRAETRTVVGDLELDSRAGTVAAPVGVLSLSPREYALLAHLMRHAGEVRSRSELHRDVWGNDFDRGTNLINVYVNYVRTKLREAGSTAAITTIRGYGYRLDAEVEATSESEPIAGDLL